MDRDLRVRHRGPRAGAVGLLCGLAACGAEQRTPAPEPATGRDFRALSTVERDAVARDCRDRSAARARGRAADQLKAIDPAALRAELDDAFRVVALQRHSVASACAQAIPLVTPGLRVVFDGARAARDGTWSVQTRSDRPLRLAGRVAPAPRAGTVSARREVGPPTRATATVGAGGRFALSAIVLRKVADNTFTVTVHAPPNADRRVLFSAICLDCLAGAQPPS